MLITPTWESNPRHPMQKAGPLPPQSPHIDNEIFMLKIRTLHVFWTLGSPSHYDSTHLAFNSGALDPTVFLLTILRVLFSNVANSACTYSRALVSWFTIVYVIIQTYSRWIKTAELGSQHCARNPRPRCHHQNNETLQTVLCRSVLCYRGPGLVSKEIQYKYSEWWRLVLFYFVLYVLNV